jgi:DHA1 family bicyclomycin/chloramphenicol resistance-like MFS transporter
MDSISPSRKRLLAILIMVATSFMVSSLDIYLPAMPMMRDYFGTTEYVMQLSMMVSPLTSAAVSLFFGRMCDVHGRFNWRVRLLLCGHYTILHG